MFLIESALVCIDSCGSYIEDNKVENFLETEEVKLQYLSEN